MARLHRGVPDLAISRADSDQLESAAAYNVPSALRPGNPFAKRRSESGDQRGGRDPSRSCNDAARENKIFIKLTIKTDP